MILLASALPVTVCRAEDSAVQRRQRVENMEPAEKKQLLRHHKRFTALPPEEQERLWDLHRGLVNHANADQLRRVMRAYYEWLGSLPVDTRTELLHLEPKQRIERIRELRAERPSPSDMEGLRRWMQQYAAKPEHQDEILKAMPKEARPFVTVMMNRMNKSPEARSWLTMWTVRMQMSRLGRPGWLTDERLADLRNHLSDDTRKRLELKPTAKQWETISSWVRPSGGRSLSSRRFRGGPPPKEFQEQLDRFFEKELTAEEKEELLNLPADEMQRRLQWMYFRRSLPMRPPGPIHGRRPDGRSPGPPGPPRGRSPQGRPGSGQPLGKPLPRSD
jgi:hypothetical protein